MKKLQKLMALMMALMMLLGVVPAMAEGAQSPAAENLGEPGAIAYLMFADGAWVNQVWNPGERPAGMTITEAPIYGEGDYSVGVASILLLRALPSPRWASPMARKPTPAGRSASTRSASTARPSRPRRATPLLTTAS